MKKTIVKHFLGICFLSAALFALPVLLFAADSVKFGVIDVQKVLNESETGKKAKSDLDAFTKSKVTFLEDKGKAIEKFKSDMEKQASVLSAEARKSKEEELDKMIREYQRLGQDSEAEFRKKRAELEEMILKEIFELVDKIGKEEGYTLIIDRSVVLFLNKDIDITDKVIKKYDELKAKSKK